MGSDSRSRSRSRERSTAVTDIEKVTQLCSAVEQSLRNALDKAAGKAGDVVVVLDLDETCFTADTDNALATSAWFEDLMQRWVPTLGPEEGMSHSDVLLECLAVVDCFYGLVPARLTEEALPGLLRTCQTGGIATVGLTARRPDLAPVTWQQLGNCVLVFDSLSPPPSEASVNELEEFLKANGHAAPDNPDRWEGIRQDRGVWFTANANKGAVLRQTLKAGMHVIFADDSERHLHCVKDALDGHAASLSLLHYTAAKDAAKERLNIESCDIALARHCATLFQNKHEAFMQLVQQKQRFLKAFITRQLRQIEDGQKQVDAPLRSLAACLQ